MSALAKIQYISDEAGKPTGVIVPIDLWREVFAEQVGGESRPTPPLPRQEVWRSLLSQADRIAASWQGSRSVIDLVDEQRR